MTIDTTEYKEGERKKIRQPKEEEDPQKIEYAKMVEYLKKYQRDLEEEKNELEEQRSYLKFKKEIEVQEGLNQVESKVDSHYCRPPKLHFSPKSITSKREDAAE